MKYNILPALKLTLICLIFLSGIYTLLIWAIAQVAPAKGEGQSVQVNSRVVGYQLEGQKFSGDGYFWSRPSAVGYNAMGSGGSNKGPSNPDYLQDMRNRIDTFQLHNPDIRKQDIPSELLTSSASGLDPDLSPEGAYVQIPRIARARRMTVDKLKLLVEEHVDRPLFGILGMEKINVLELNIELEKMK
jgi:K+-transporting ATPase ATPase C chain